MQFTYESANRDQVQKIVAERIPNANLIWEYWGMCIDRRTDIFLLAKVTT